MNYDELMRRARAVNRKRDALDREIAPAHAELNRRGAPMPIEPGAPIDLPVVDHIRTAMMAIECGIKTDDWGAVAEGLAMIEDIERRLGSDK